jgi:hypothetical protein
MKGRRRVRDYYNARIFFSKLMIEKFFPPTPSKQKNESHTTIITKGHLLLLFACHCCVSKVRKKVKALGIKTHTHTHTAGI